MSPSGRGGYLAVSALLALAAGLAMVAGPGSDPASTVVGLGSAWVVQAPAWWFLAGDLAGGRRATRSWVAGMAARLGGLVVLAVAAGPGGLDRPTTLIAYAGAMLGFLTLEAFWLHLLGPGPPDAGDETRR